ncbi:HupE/UreJ family protein [Dichotomicrobium thermohalophilum]|uniref:Urease accessory protein n=1 Tax=Dichotomicrobium thermohalophilum TaxID=933063 RepID=A0A397QD15_9HYPH|nr:HupE/UreJ family protein [Dichotomicrobium thermohalophilum]RIA56151.1 urease accessory protein [Dichotomicrobium thermohalophilum]
MLLRSLFLTLALCLIAVPAAAHTGHGEVSGFTYGLMHPIGGLDHVLAMVAVGLLAYLIGGAALWGLPLAFIAAMAAGGALALYGFALPYVEAGIALSVVVIGAMVTLGKSTPGLLAAALTAVFAIFHGHAHGAEMPATASGLSYGIGFMLATALLHGGGILAGFALGAAGRQAGLNLARGIGGVMALSGVAILGGVI